MDERPPIWTVADKILNKQSWTADKGWSSSLGVGRGADWSQGMLAIIRCWIFCLPVCYPKI